jgi:hypothetical protein
MSPRSLCLDAARTHILTYITVFAISKKNALPCCFSPLSMMAYLTDGIIMGQFSVSLSSNPGLKEGIHYY